MDGIMARLPNGVETPHASNLNLNLELTVLWYLYLEEKMIFFCSFAVESRILQWLKPTLTYIP